MLLSTISFALMNALIKYLIDYSTFQLVFFRSLGSLFITFGILKSQKINIWGNQKKLLLLRGLVGATSMILFFLGIHYINVGSAVTLRYTSPIFAAVFAVIFLGKTIKLIQWIFFLISFFGVYLIKSYDPSGSNFGVFIVLVSAFLSAIVYFIISKIGKRDNSVVIVHYFMIFSTVIGGIGSIFFWIIPNTKDIFLLFSLGFFGFFGQLFMTRAFQSAEAHIVAPFKYIEVIFTLLFGIYVIDEKYDLFHLLGAFFVILGLLLNVFFRSKNGD